MKITHIRAVEDEPCLSAFDPYYPTAFGSFKCKINGHILSVGTIDRNIDSIFVDEKRIELCSIEDLKEVNSFIRSLWKLTYADVELPASIAKLVA